MLVVIGTGATLSAPARFFGLVSEDNSGPLFRRKLFQLDLPFGHRRNRREGTGQRARPEAGEGSGVLVVEIHFRGGGLGRLLQQALHGFLRAGG